MVKVLILGPTLQQRVTEPEMDVEVEGSVPIKLLIEGNADLMDALAPFVVRRIARDREPQGRLARFRGERRRCLKNLPPIPRLLRRHHRYSYLSRRLREEAQERMADSV